MKETPIIVVGVDETVSSQRALRWAAAEAVLRQARLHVITAWTWEPVEGAALAAVDPEAMRVVAEQTQEAAVRELLEELSPAPEMRTEIVQAPAADALVEASRGATLVVVGTHGRGPVRSFLLGSVSQSVIRHADCPVVVMPPVHAAGEREMS
jgi:nucleotide-binding universal stress UspA family protein